MAMRCGCCCCYYCRTAMTLQTKVRGLFPPNNSKRRPPPLWPRPFPEGRGKPAGRQTAAGLTRRFWRREDWNDDLGSSSQNLFRPTTRTTTTSCHGGFNRGAELSSAARSGLDLSLRAAEETGRPAGCGWPDSSFLKERRLVLRPRRRQQQPELVPSYD